MARFYAGSMHGLHAAALGNRQAFAGRLQLGQAGLGVFSSLQTLGRFALGGGHGAVPLNAFLQILLTALSQSRCAKRPQAGRPKQHSHLAMSSAHQKGRLS
jgi:hypothetical protein